MKAAHMSKPDSWREWHSEPREFPKCILWGQPAGMLTRSTPCEKIMKTRGQHPGAVQQKHTQQLPLKVPVPRQTWMELGQEDVKGAASALLEVGFLPTPRGRTEGVTNKTLTGIQRLDYRSFLTRILCF